MKDIIVDETEHGISLYRIHFLCEKTTNRPADMIKYVSATSGISKGAMGGI
jgi:hypothetical protein